MLKIQQYEWKVYTMQIYKINNSYEKSYNSNEKSCNKSGMKIYIKIVHYHWFFFNTNENLHITNGKTKYCDIWHAIKNP